MLLSCQMINDDLVGMENNLEFFSDFHPKNQPEQPCNFTPCWPVMFCRWWLQDWWLCGSAAHICSQTQSASHDAQTRARAHMRARYHTLPSARTQASRTHSQEHVQHSHTQSTQVVHSHPMCTESTQHLLYCTVHIQYAHTVLQHYSLTIASSQARSCVQTHPHSVTPLTSAHRSQEPPLPSFAVKPRNYVKPLSVFIPPLLTVHYPHHLPCSHLPSNLG